MSWITDEIKKKADEKNRVDKNRQDSAKELAIRQESITTLWNLIIKENDVLPEQLRLAYDVNNIFGKCLRRDVKSNDSPNLSTIGPSISVFVGGLQGSIEPYQPGTGKQQYSLKYYKDKMRTAIIKDANIFARLLIKAAVTKDCWNLYNL